ncbi:MAG TPA: hypothetical protein VL463_21675, partial [Kofleriaceae bacterium]|nr:hypothetical protein [Kofleriaceae bacterium]
MCSNSTTSARTKAQAGSSSVAAGQSSSEVPRGIWKGSSVVRRCGRVSRIAAAIRSGTVATSALPS